MTAKRMAQGSGYIGSLGVACCGTLLLVSGALRADEPDPVIQRPAESFPVADGGIDIRRFGAIPDDGKDDTAAIQAAATFADKRSKAFQPAGSSYLGCAPAVFFPTGVYDISGEICFGGYAAVVGAPGKAMLRWTARNPPSAPPPEAFFRVTCYTVRIENLIFVGGPGHVILSNRNIDKTVVNISDCEFHLAEGFAIRVVPLEPATWMSAHVTIEDCRFISNYHVLENRADVMRIAGGWVTSGHPRKGGDAAVFVNRHGWLHLEDVVGVPGQVGPGSRWVDNYAWVRAVATRFGGERGGIPVIRNHAGLRTTYPYCHGGKIIVRDCQISAGSSRPEAALLTLFDIPQQIVIEGNNYLVNAPMIRVDGSLNLEKALADIGRDKANLNILIQGNLTWPPSLEQAIPAALRPFVVGDAAGREGTGVGAGRSEGEQR